MKVETLLQLAALILSVMNGLILVRVHVRDRARLVPTPVHPDSYQWWFEIPVPEATNRRFGFLAYVDIANRGYRDVDLSNWELEVAAVNGQRATLAPLSMPEPKTDIGGAYKIYPVLGQKGLMHEARMRVQAGGSTSGMALFILESGLAPGWTPTIQNERIEARFFVRHVFGGKAKCKIAFRHSTLGKIRELVPELDQIVKTIEKQRAG